MVGVVDRQNFVEHCPVLYLYFSPTLHFYCEDGGCCLDVETPCRVEVPVCQNGRLIIADASEPLDLRDRKV